MATLMVSTRGQVTFRKDVLLHLGIKPGEKVELQLLPDGRGHGQVAAAGPFILAKEHGAVFDAELDVRLLGMLHDLGPGLLQQRPVSGDRLLRITKVTGTLSCAAVHSA